MSINKKFFNKSIDWKRIILGVVVGGFILFIASLLYYYFTSYRFYLEAIQRQSRAYEIEKRFYEEKGITPPASWPGF